MSGFTPTVDRLMPELTDRQTLALLARALWREGYDDHLAGHITADLGDGTLLCNPWLLTWAEVRPEHVLRITLEGEVVEGEWPVPLGIPLHLELHRRRPDVGWAAHSHPRFGTVWADVAEVPPILDQSSALGVGSSYWSTSTRARWTTPGRRAGPSRPWATPRRRCWPATGCS